MTEEREVEHERHEPGIVWPEPRDDPETEPDEPWARPDVPDQDD